MANQSETQARAESFPRFRVRRNIRENPDGGLVMDHRRPGYGEASSPTIVGAFDTMAEAEAMAALWNERDAAGEQFPTARRRQDATGMVDLHVRVPRALHARLVALAESERRSLNNQVIATLERATETSG